MKAMRDPGVLAVLAVVLATVLVACRDQAPPPLPAPEAPARYEKSVPDIGARVRVIVPELGPGWRVASFNRTRQEPPCYLVLIFNPSHDRTVAATVYVRAVVRMQVSTLYRGDSAVDRDPAAAAYEGERWLDASLDSASRTGRNCPRGIERAR